MKTSNIAEVYVQEIAAMRGVKREIPGQMKNGAKHFPIPQVPMTWLDATSWRLPSGKALAEFALQAGFLAPFLFKTENFAGRSAPENRKQVVSAHGTIRRSHREQDLDIGRRRYRSVVGGFFEKGGNG